MKNSDDIFRAYDIRGSYPDQINEDLAYKLGGAVVTFLKSKRLVVGMDGRVSSPSLSNKLIEGILDAGCDIIFIKQCTTPFFYFSVNNIKADGGIMVTASHNPAEFNGFKIVRQESEPVALNSGLNDIYKLLEGENKAYPRGRLIEQNPINDYIEFLIKESRFTSQYYVRRAQALKIVVDAGHGITPLVLKPLLDRLGFNYIPMFFEIDGNFPDRQPDISKDENLTALKEKIKELKADLGIAFDADGDRVVFIDEEGERIMPYHILALLYRANSGILNKIKVVYDSRSSKSVKELLGYSGIPSKAGHTFMKETMKRNKADIGVELSGHFFFKEMSYAESAILAALKVLKVLSDSNRPASELILPFKKYFYSGEINIPIENRDRGDKIIEELKHIYQHGILSELDGVTIEYKDWWFNVRLSNTESVLRMITEGDTGEILDSKVSELMAVVKNIA